MYTYFTVCYETNILPSVSPTKREKKIFHWPCTLWSHTKTSWFSRWKMFQRKILKKIKEDQWDLLVILEIFRKSVDFQTGGDICILSFQVQPGRKQSGEWGLIVLYLHDVAPRQLYFSKNKGQRMSHVVLFKLKMLYAITPDSWQLYTLFTVFCIFFILARSYSSYSLHSLNRARHPGISV